MTRANSDINYLDKSFNYKHLVKADLSKILTENGIAVPELTKIKRHGLLLLYKRNIYDKIDDLIKQKIAEQEKKLKPEKSKNIFQSPRKSPRDPSKMRDKGLPAEPSETRVNKQIFDKIKTGESERVNSHSDVGKSINKTRVNKQISDKIKTEESERVNSHSDVGKSINKTRKGFVYLTEGLMERESSMSYVRSLALTLLLLAIVLAFVIIKIVCPYCEGPDGEGPGLSFCIRPPKHCIQKNDEIICEPKYEFVRNLLLPNYCRKKVSRHQQIQRFLCDLRTRLRRMLGLYRLGLKSTFCLQIQPLSFETSEEKKLFESYLMKYEIRFNELFIYTTSFSVPVYLYPFYIAKKVYRVILMGLLTPTILIGFLYYLIKLLLLIRKRRREFQMKVSKLTAQILNTLQKQAVISAKNPRVDVRLSCLQLRVCYNIKDDMWGTVFNAVSDSPNIKAKVETFNGKNVPVWVWVGPIVITNDENTV